MIPLNPSDRTTLDRLLGSSHSVDIRVHITDIVGRTIYDVSDRLIGGQVDVDVDGDVTRVAQLSLFDPNKEVAFDSRDPSGAAIYMDNMIMIEYGIRGEGQNTFIHVPVFMGPVVALQRDEDLIQITAFGKEHLANGTLWWNFNAGAGANKINVIKRIMSECAGETRFMLPEMPNERMGEPLSLVALEQTAWEAAQGLAESIGRVLYYDGAGRLRMRRKTGNKVFTFEGGDNGTLMSVPVISFSTEGAKNAVVVRGVREMAGKSGESQKVITVTAQAVLPPNHPLNPYALGRPNGEQVIIPRFLTEVVENDDISNQQAAERIAAETLEDLATQNVEVKFDAQPVPYLEEYDRVALEHDDFDTAFVLRQFSIPLSIGDTMSIGYNRRLMTVDRTRMSTSSTRRVKTIHKDKNEPVRKKKPKKKTQKGKK